MSGKHSFQILSMLTTTILLSGCCITPIDGDIDSTRTRFFAGFTSNPNDVISIQAIDPEDSNWHTIATLRPSTRRYWSHWYWGSSPIYRWSRRVHIPSRYWYNDSLVISWDAPFRPFTAVCHVRVVDSGNNVLVTYKQPLTEQELRHGNPAVLYSEKGNSRDHLKLQLLSESP